MVKPGDVIQVRKPPVTYSFKVLQAIEKRIGAKLVPEMMLIRPFLHASAAMVRVLKIRTAHIHLSILASLISFLVGS